MHLHGAGAWAWLRTHSTSWTSFPALLFPFFMAYSTLASSHLLVLQFLHLLASCPRLRLIWTNFCIPFFSKPKLFAAVFILSHLPSPVSSGDSGVSVSFVFRLLFLASLVYYLPLLLDLSSTCWKYVWLLIPCPLCAGDWTQNLANIQGKHYL